MGESSQVRRKVSVRNIAKVPRVSIDGKSTRSMYRSNKLTLFARGSVPKCDDDNSMTKDSLSYSWKVYIGSRYQSAIVSSSKAPRLFKLDGFTLDSNTVYTVNVVAELDGISSSSFVTVEVGSSGVVAGIVGGAKRSASTSSEVTFSSSSYDIDYPTDFSDLSYTWVCAEVSPNFGAACPGSLVASSSGNTASIPANTFTRSVDATYSITLNVEKISTGDSDSVTIEVEMVSTAIPDISFSAVESKYNSMDKIILSATVDTIDVATVAWSSEDLTSSEIASKNLTALSYEVPSGTTLAELAIMPDALEAGATYTFLLLAQYPSSSNSKWEEVTIVINSPPSDGSLEVTPNTGTTMATEFYFATFDWQDDVDDLPITYIMYTKSDPGASTAMSVIKTSDESTYVYAMIEQGLEEQLSLPYLEDASQ